MRFARNADIRVKDLGTESAPEQRRHGRLRMQDVECSIGEVLDISASGMRVRTKMKLPDEHQVFVVTLTTMEGPMAVLTRVRWTRKTGLFTREAGLEFFDVGPKTRQALIELAGRVAHNEGLWSQGA